MKQSAKNSKLKLFSWTLTVLLFTTAVLNLSVAAQTKSNSAVFLRFKIVSPNAGKFKVNISGFRHEDPWVFPSVQVGSVAGNWTEWIDLSGWKWHGRLNRSGGVAEWNSVELSILDLNLNQQKGCYFEVQLSDAPSDNDAIVSFNEQSASASVAFLLPFPLRENAAEFETGSQMTARHGLWARAATNNNPITLKKFKFITQIWGHYDPNLEKQETLMLKSLGFSSIGTISAQILSETKMQTYQTTGIYEPDPDKVVKDWNALVQPYLNPSAGAQQKAENTAHWVIADEVSALDFRNVEPAKLNGWFRDFLKSEKISEKEIGMPSEQAEYPAKAMFEPVLNRNAPLKTRRLLYYAAKFGQFWSAKQLRQTSDLIRQTFPNMNTQALLPSHGFLGNAWGPAYIGMSYRNLDFFEVGAQQSVTQMSAEDWLGLNHMYGPRYTWTGGQTFGYFNALLRSAIADRPIALRGLITPSDSDYLQLKAYSSIGQGAKSFFFWAFGPTYIGTENYWSDLRSEYDGIARLGRSLAKAENVLYPAKTVSDPVAVLYSVSHDLWNTDNSAAFAEKRLLWHALRHLQIQPDFLREEDVENDKLKNYKVLYITDWCVSRRASAAIDKWVKAGGVLYLSAGAATRDEFDEPFVPPFARKIWESDAAQKLVAEKHLYNERIDLPNIKPLTTAKINLNNRQFDLPVIGVRAALNRNANEFAAFADGKTAGIIEPYGKGQIVAVGFMPMLAYGQTANFQPETLAEKWQPEAREIIKTALDAGNISSVAKASVPVIETDFLNGANGAVVVLANYTYQPIDNLTIEVKTSEPFKNAVSTEGVPVKIERSGDLLRLKLPLKWTDMIILTK